jgi:hypothetical protein
MAAAQVRGGGLVFVHCAGEGQHGVDPYNEGNRLCGMEDGNYPPR